LSKSIKQLEPKALWGYFAALSKIPRGSKNETAVMAWITQLAEDRGLTTKQDEVGNLVVLVPSTAGLEQAPTIVFQSHVDMVCEKNYDVEHDFERDPIKPYIDGDRVTAPGTTLGADNGIGVAAALAMMDVTDCPHGPLELLFTVDEETGLTGAFGIGDNMFSGRIMINMDAEEVGRFTIGSAGGADTNITFPAPREPQIGLSGYRLTVSGLKGGHSGGDIDKNRGNSINILGRLLLAALEDPSVGDIQLAAAIGGSKRNAIPRQAVSTIAVPGGTDQAFERIIKEHSESIREQLSESDAEFEIDLTPLSSEETETKAVCTPTDSARLIRLLNALPCGVLGNSIDIEGLVETSSNVAVLVDFGDSFEITCSTRSSVDQALKNVLGQLRSISHLAGATTTHSDGYPGWKPKLGTPLLMTVESIYKKMFGEAPTFEALHAGLECGLFKGKYPDLEIVAYGAEIVEAHSPDEWVSISSVSKFWDFTKQLVSELAKTDQTIQS